jgi:hypothetical protein
MEKFRFDSEKDQDAMIAMAFRIKSLIENQVDQKADLRTKNDGRKRNLLKHHKEILAGFNQLREWLAERQSWFDHPPNGRPFDSLADYLKNPLKPLFYNSIVMDFELTQAYSEVTSLMEATLKAVTVLMILGIPNALHKMGVIAHEIVSNINSYRELDPVGFDRNIQYYNSWPIITSTHPKLRDDPRSLLSSLGRVFFYDIGANSRLDPNETGTRIAIKLLGHVNGLRSEFNGKVDMWNRGVSGKAPRPNLEKESLVTRRAVALPSFDLRSATEWWTLAKAIFKESYPDPQSVTQFASLTVRTKTRSSDWIRSSKRSRKMLTVGQRNARITENIRGKFVSLAKRKLSS